MAPKTIVSIVGYIRVSTESQGDSGAGLAAQRSAIEAEAERRGWTISRWCEDRASGKSLDGRPGLDCALRAVRTGKADAIVCAKLDRLSRSVKDFASLLDRSQEEGWSVVVLDVAVDTSTPAGELLVGVMSQFAQFERRIISQRTKDALAEKRARGVKLGRPRTIDPRAMARIQMHAAAGRGARQIARLLLEEGILPPSGGAWSPSTVQSWMPSRAVVVAGRH